MYQFKVCEHPAYLQEGFLSKDGRWLITKSLDKVITTNVEGPAQVVVVKKGTGDNEHKDLIWQAFLSENQKWLITRSVDKVIVKSLIGHSILFSMYGEFNNIVKSKSLTLVEKRTSNEGVIFLPAQCIELTIDNLCELLKPIYSVNDISFKIDVLSDRGIERIVNQEHGAGSPAEAAD